MNKTNQTTSLAEQIAAAESSIVEAVAALEAEHKRLYEARAETKAKIKRLWSIPLKRQQLAELMLQGVDEYAGAFFARMGWRKLMTGFVRPTGKRPGIPTGAELGDGRSIDRTEPLSMADHLAVQRSPSTLKALQATLFGSRDSSSDVLSVNGVTSYSQAPQASPAFLAPDQKGEGQPLTRDELAQALCYFCGDQIKRELMAAFDAAVPAGFPAMPEGVSVEEWNASLEDRHEAIKAAAAEEVALLGQLRDLDQQVLKLAARGSDAFNRAHGRAVTADYAY